MRGSLRELRLILLFFAVGAAAAVYLQWGALTTYGVYDEDLLQSPHWVAQHKTSFLDDDEIVRYARFNESPVQNAIYFVATAFVDYIPLSKYLAVIGYGLATCLFFFVGRAMYNARTGFLMAMFVTFFPDTFKYSSGFFSKYWAMPLLLLCLYVLHARRFRWLAVLLPFAALAYPVSAVSIGLTCGCFLLLLSFAERRVAWELFRPLAVGSLLALAALGAKYLALPDFVGPFTPRAELLALLEPDGKYAPIPPVYVELAGRLLHPFTIVSAAGFLIVLGRRGFGWDRTWTALLLAATIGYVLADLFFARLYIPNRHTRNAITVLLVLWNAVNWDRVLDRIARPAWRTVTVAALFVVAGLSFDSLRRDEWVWNDERFVPVCAFIRQLPEKLLFAGPPRYLDRVMLQGERSVIVPFLLDHAWFSRRREEMNERTLDVFRAIYAPDVATVNELHGRYGATHLILSRTYFRHQLASHAYGSRIDREIDERIVRGRTDFVLASPPRDWLIYDDGFCFIVALPLPETTNPSRAS